MIDPKIGTLELSVIVPAFDEGPLLEGSIRALSAALDQSRVSTEIVIVDDGSRDRTGAIADTLSRLLPGVRVYHQTNQGIGAAFRTGADSAAGEYLMLWPVDMTATPEDLAPYIGKFGIADVIVGCRTRRVGYNPLMLLNSWIYSRLVEFLFGLHLRDVNWIHVYRRSMFQKIQLTQNGIPMLVEALVRLNDAGARLVEVEVVMKRRTVGVPSASRIGVMWRTLIGLFSFWESRRRETAEKAISSR